MIVVLRALKLGDLLTAVPALRAIRRAFPDDEVVLAAPAWLTPLALHTGAIDRVVDTAPLAPLDRSLHGADLAVNLHGRGPLSTTVLAATHPRRLIAFGRGVEWRDDEHERVRWCRLLTESGIPADPDDLHLDPPAADPGVAGVTVVHPGASTGARRWPPERWADIARRADVVITGDASEVGLARHVARLAGVPDERVIAGQTGLLDLLALVAAAEVVICGDTGIAHVASATRTPSVVLFGPTSPAQWGPPPDGPHVALWAGTTGDPLGDDPHPGLLAIGVDDVRRALTGLVRAGGDTSP